MKRNVETVHTPDPQTDAPESFTLSADPNPEVRSLPLVPSHTTPTSTTSTPSSTYASSSPLACTDENYGNGWLTHTPNPTLTRETRQANYAHLTSNYAQTMINFASKEGVIQYNASVRANIEFINSASICACCGYHMNTGTYDKIDNLLDAAISYHWYQHDITLKKCFTCINCGREECDNCHYETRPSTHSCHYSNWKRTIYTYIPTLNE